MLDQIFYFQKESIIFLKVASTAATNLSFLYFLQVNDHHHNRVRNNFFLLQTKEIQI